jgi:uncharacterized membrane protein YhhN
MGSRQSRVLLSESGYARFTLVALTVTMGLLVFLVAPLHLYSTVLIGVSLGLLVSVVGDSLLVLRGHGRVRYLTYSLSTVFYTAAYWSQSNGTIHWWLPILLFCSGIVLLLLILPQVESRVFPSIFTGVLLMTLFWATVELWLQQHTFGVLLAVIGALGLFITAFSIAVRKERCVFQSTSLSLLIIYTASQILFTISVLI